MRIQLALNVRDIDEAVSFYSKLFGVEPHKRREAYANFAIQEPPLKLVLFENPAADGRLHHLGVEVLDAGDLERSRERLGEAGLVERVQRDTACCHATQDKIWTKEPQGLPWEWYWISRDESPSGRDSLGKTCCTGKNRMDNIAAT